MQFNAVFKFNLDSLVGTRKVVMYKVSSSVLMGIVAIGAGPLLTAHNLLITRICVAIFYDIEIPD